MFTGAIEIHIEAYVVCFFYGSLQYTPLATLICKMYVSNFRNYLVDLELDRSIGGRSIDKFLHIL